MFRRRILIAALAFGTIAGYGAGFASLACHARHGHHGWDRGWQGSGWHHDPACNDGPDRGERREAQ